MYLPGAGGPQVGTNATRFSGVSYQRLMLSDAIFRIKGKVNIYNMCIMDAGGPAYELSSS